MNVFIQLTSAGTHTGPFSLYSDVDGYVSPFQSNISRNKLLSGFLSILVPANTTIIRIQSEEDCDTYVDVTVGLTPTTTTTTTLFPPTTTTTTTGIPSPTTTTTSTTESGVIGEECPQTETGVYETLNSSHTYPTFIIDFGVGATGTINTVVEPYTNTPNRFTIRNYYDNNIVYTTGWVGYATYPGPWGMTLSNPAPATSPLTLVNRYYRFEVETVTGSEYTDAWEWYVPCGDVTTTTTSTTALPVQTMLIARAASGTTESDAEGLCGNLYNVDVDLDTVQIVYFQSASPIPDDVMQQPLFVDINCTITFDGSDGTWWGAITEWDLITNNTYNYAIVISSPPGLVTLLTWCTPTTTTTTTTLAYHVEMGVNDTTYDELNEVNIPYSLAPTLINSPTKAGYNYFFLSIPVDRTFTLLDSLSTDVTSTMTIDVASGVGGLDIRTGYHNNYIYKSDDAFATSYSTQFTLTLS